MTATTPDTAALDQNTSSRRRMLYGSNLALLVLIAVVIVGFLAYLTDRYNYRKDWTSSGIHSLSPATRKLLAEIDKKNQSFELLSTFTIGASTAQTDMEQAQQVADLLEEYHRNSPHVTVQTREDRQKLEEKIKERYSGELATYETVMADFKKLADAVDKFLKDEAASFSALAQSSKDEETTQTASAMQLLFNTQVPQRISRVRREVDRTLESTLPDYSAAKTSISGFLDTLSQVIEPMSRPEQLSGKTSKAFIDYLTSAKPRYTAMLEQVKKYQERLTKLPELKIDEVRRELGPDSVVVFGPSAVKVISYSDIFKPQREASAQGPKYSFEGEQALSSALLSMARPEKPKVVFISTTPNITRSGPYSDMADLLTKSNFEVLDWTPPAPPMSPDQPPPEPNPPASGKGVVWIVFPPDSPAGPMGPSPAGALVEAVKKHIDGGGQALFLAEADNPMAAMMGGGGGGFPYAELVKPFGIEVRAEYTAVKRYQSPDGDQVIPFFEITRFPDTPITKPLQSLPTLFAANQSRMGFMNAPTVVTATKEAGAESMVIVETEKSADYWATKGPIGEDTKFKPAEDLAAPVSLGVASVRNKGKDNEQRAVVIGSRMIAINQILERIRAERRGDTLVPVQADPGNSELFLNSVLWLSGYENMIAVSAKATVALRIKDIAPATLAAIDWSLWLGLPVLALVLGGVVYFIRRR